MRDVLAGRKERFGMLVERYQNLVYSTILTRVGRVHEAEDLAQSTFLKGFANLNALGEPARFGAWLRRIAANEAAEHLRRRLVRDRAVDQVRAEIEQPGDMPDAELLREEAHGALWAAVSALPEAQREVVLLYYTEPRSQEEVAAYLSISVAAVKGRLRRAKEELRDALLERQLRKELGGRKLDKDFRKRVMSALPMTPWTEASPPWGWSRLGWVAAVAAFGALTGGGLVTWLLAGQTQQGAPMAIHVRLAALDAEPGIRRQSAAWEGGAAWHGADGVDPAARELEGEALRRGWGGRLAWEFEQDDGGWRAREPDVSQADPVRLATTVRGGVLEIALGTGRPGRVPAVELVSPELGYDSRLFDRVELRVRVVGGEGSRAGWVGVSWTNELNRPFPGADPDGRRRWGAGDAAETAASRFGVVRQLRLEEGWQTVAVAQLDRVDPTRWVGALTDLRLTLGLDEAVAVSEGHAPAAVQIDRIELGVAPPRRVQELPRPTPVRTAHAGTWLAPGVVHDLPQRGLRRPMLGDLDGDGDADLVMGYDQTDAQWNRHKGWVGAVNDGHGRFAPGREHTVEYRKDGYSSPVNLWLADVNGDGAVDVVIRAGARTLLQMNRDNGRLWRTVTWEDRAAIGVGDVDGDGDADVALVSGGGPGARWGPVADRTVFAMNDGRGGFAAIEAVAGDEEGWTPVDLQDLDGDGMAELVWQRSWAGGTRATLRVDRGWRAGRWAETQRIEFEVSPESVEHGLPVWAAHVADLDRDGRWEVGLPEGAYGDQGVYTAGMWLVAAKMPSQPWLPSDVHLRHDADLTTGVTPQRWDLDGDGLTDAVFASDNLRAGPQVVVMRGQPVGMPSEEGRYAVAGSPRGWAVADADGDGAADVAVTVVGAGGSGVVVMRNVAAMPVPVWAGDDEGRKARQAVGKMVKVE